LQQNPEHQLTLKRRHENSPRWELTRYEDELHELIGE
jgi:hypothetical protein